MVAMNVSISVPMLKKPKCVYKLTIGLDSFQLFVYNFSSIIWTMDYVYFLLGKCNNTAKLQRSIVTYGSYVFLDVFVFFVFDFLRFFVDHFGKS